MDTGMLVAAATLRVLSARRASIGERWVHIAIMVIVAVIEASTYAYMSVSLRNSRQCHSARSHTRPPDVLALRLDSNAPRPRR